MTDVSAVNLIPEHLHTVTPRLVVPAGAGAAAIDFYRRAFACEQVGEPFTMPDGQLVHVELRIGDSIVMLTEETENGSPARAPGRVGGVVTAIMATYWEDVDGVWNRALAAGAEIIYPLENQFYGERAGRLRDPFGHQWMLSRRLSPEEQQ